MQPNWIDGLPDTPRRAMQAAMVARSFGKGAMLYGRNEAPPGLCLIRDGSALACLDAANGRRLLLKILRPGELFGETVAFDGQSAAISVEARSDIAIAIVPPQVLAALKQAHPEIDAALGRVAGYFLRAMFEVAIEQALLPIEPRVASRLALLCRMDGVAGDEPGTVLLELSQAELALMLGSTRQSVNAVLGRLEKVGAVTRRFRTIEVRPALLPTIN